MAQTKFTADELDDINTVRNHLEDLEIALRPHRVYFEVSGAEHTVALTLVGEDGNYLLEVEG